MANRIRILASLLLVVAACGDDDGGGGGIDGGGDGNNVTCASATAEITSYPGMFAGTIKGQGKDLSAAEDTCAENTGGGWFDPNGEDTVVALHGLTAGKTYVVDLDTQDDLSFYVTTDCPAASPVTGCLVFTDESYKAERGAFTAASADAFLVIDSAEAEGVPPTGDFTAKVEEAVCTEATEATACAAATPFCSDFACVACLTAFDCTAAATPVCSAEGACVAGPTSCTADDAGDTAPGDDGPAAARTLAMPTLAVPTVQASSICNVTTAEADWYKITTTGDLGVSLAFTGAGNDLDVYLLSSQGATVMAGKVSGTVNEAFHTLNLPPSTYYLVVRQHAPTGTTAAVPYTLTVTVPTCNDNFGCAVAAAPVCGGAGSCGVGPALCVNDDAGDPNDDGPAGARTLTSGTAITGAACTSPASEADYYKIAVTAGQGLTFNLAWAGATVDFDLYIYGPDGKAYGESFYKNPEVVTLTQLPAGTYYARVANFGTASTAVTEYTLTATTTAAIGCTDATSCATNYKTQRFRGVCTTGTGACSFIPAGAGAAATICDSGDDCVSKLCSYLSYESDAQNSVCTTACDTDAQCSGGLRCNAALGRCVPACTTNLECGVNQGSDTIDTGEAWDYLTCTSGACGI